MEEEEDVSREPSGTWPRLLEWQLLQLTVGRAAPPGAVEEKQENFNCHTPLRYLSCSSLSPSIRLAVSSLLTTDRSRHVSRGLRSVSDVSLTDTCFLFLSRFLSNHTTAPDKQRPDSWPRVQAAIGADFKVQAFEREANTLDQPFQAFCFTKGLAQILAVKRNFI